jgi:hypothetical protein
MTRFVPIDEFSFGNAQVNNGGGTSEGFQCLDEQCWPNTHNGSTLSGNAAGYSYMLGGSGVRVTFGLVGNNILGTAGRFYSFYGTQIAYPNGETLTFTYQQGVSGGTNYTRPTKIVSNLGYEMQFTYQAGAVGTSQWSTLATATIYNSSDTNTALARHTYGSGGTITDLAMREWSCCSDGMDTALQIADVTMRLPDMTNDSFDATPTTTHTQTPRVAQIESDGVVWTYQGTETTGTGKCTRSHTNGDHRTAQF